MGEQMRGWLAHMSMKVNLLFITQTVAIAGVEVVILSVAYLLSASVCWCVVRCLEYCVIMFVPVLNMYTVGTVCVYVNC